MPRCTGAPARAAFSYDASDSSLLLTQPGWLHAGRGLDRLTRPCESQMASMSWLANASRIRARALSEYRGIL